MMFPRMDRSSDPSFRQRKLKALLILLAAVGALSVGALFAPETLGSPVVGVVFFVAFAAAILGVLGFRASRAPREKAKRDSETSDLYSVIDRMVNELDDDEANYLQRRLDERSAQQKDDLTLSLEDVLDRRAGGQPTK